MTQIFTIALHALKSINEVILGRDRLSENRLLTQAKMNVYTYMLYTRM